MSTKRVKTKLFLILALLGAIPFVAAIAFIGWFVWISICNLCFIGL